MTLVAQVSLPREAAPLGSAARGRTEIELDRIVPRGGSAVHYFWVRSGDHRGVETRLSNLDVRDLRTLDGLPDRRLYRGTWDADEPLVGALADHDAEVLYGRSRGDRWELQLRFADGSALFDFQRHCVETAGLQLQLQEVFDPARTAAFGPELTDCQRETLVTAYEAGYFDIPRRTTLVELSETLGVSDQAISERIRRAESKLVGRYVVGSDGSKIDRTREPTATGSELHGDRRT